MYVLQRSQIACKRGDYHHQQAHISHRVWGYSKVGSVIFLIYIFLQQI